MSAELAQILVGLRQRLRAASGQFAPFSLNESAVALSIRQRVAPLLYDWLAAGQTVSGDAPAIRAALQPSFYRTLLRNGQLLQMAERVCGILHANGVDAVRLKGADLLHSLYGDAGLRPMDDIDILVAPESARDAIRLLESNGFRHTENALPIEFYLQHHLHVALIDPVSGGYLEVHWQLLDPFKRAGLDGSFAVATAVDLVPGKPELGKRLRSDVRYLYLALHVDKHGPFHELLVRRRNAAVALLHPSSEAKLLWLYDLALQQTVEPVSAHGMAELASSLGVARGVWTTLRMVSELFGTDCVEAGLVAALAPNDDGRIHRVVSRLVGSILDSRSLRLRRLLDWSMRMDQAAQFRPLRLLQLPLHFVTPRGGDRSFGSTLWRPLQDLWRGARLALSLARFHVQRRLGVGA